MDTRVKRIIAVSGVVFLAAIVGALVFYFLSPKHPATQTSDKTVIIDNYADYTEHISSDSFGYLGNYLYGFIDNPKQGVYHATIVDGSYSYASDSWFSKFVVEVKDSDVSWNISLQTLRNGEINGDIAITCNSGASCVPLSQKMNSTRALQDLLPINTNDYIIAYKTGDYNALSIVYYDREGTGKEKALEKIKSLGFKPEDYTIDYYYGGR